MNFQTQIIFVFAIFSFAECTRDMSGKKQFKKKASEIKPLISDNRECFISDKIMVEGKPIRLMYREKPNKQRDSGWRFFSGTETQEYSDNPQNTTLDYLNTAANYDPSIIPLLNSPVHSAFEKKPESKQFSPVTDFEFTED